jgi:hypothetical protein
VPAQGTLPALHRPQEAGLPARGGQRLAPLPVLQGPPLPKAAHRPGLPAFELLRGRPRGQGLQRPLRARAPQQRARLHPGQVTRAGPPNQPASQPAKTASRPSSVLSSRVPSDPAADHFYPTSKYAPNEQTALITQAVLAPGPRKGRATLAGPRAR